MADASTSTLVHTPMDAQLQEKCSTMLREEIMKKKMASIFVEPVDWRGMGLLDYLTYVKQPMDLGTVQPVDGVLVQGRKDHNQHVTKFTVATSIDGTTFEPVESAKEFTYARANDKDDSKYLSEGRRNRFGTVMARYVRIYPIDCIEHYSMRAAATICGAAQFRNTIDVAIDAAGNLFAIDEYTRYVFVDFVKLKSEAADAVKRIIAAFNATVGTPVDDAGRAYPPLAASRRGRSGARRDRRRRRRPRRVR